MKKQTIEFLSFIYITIFLVVMLNLVIKTIYTDISLEAYATYVYICGGIGLLLYIASKIKNFKFNKYEIAVFIMMILSCLSLINAVDLHIAIFGKAKRYEGLLVWLSYDVFILNAMNIKNKKYLYIIVSLISVHMLSNIYYGLYQLSILKNPTFYVKLLNNYATGFLGHSNFLGSMSTIFYGLMLGLFIKVEMGWKKYFFAVALLIANLGVLINGAMSAIAAVIVINIVCFIQIIVLIIKKKKKAFAYLGSLIVGILSFGLVFYVYSLDHEKIKNDTKELFSQAEDVVTGNEVGDNYGTGRVYIWKNALEKMKESPITGYGIDNFREAFDSKLIVDKAIVDKAHNDYLQKAFCEGIISGIVFVAFLLTIFFRGIFKDLPPIYYGLLLAFTCYSVQAFFNISFINVAPIYFIITGLLIGKLNEKSNLKNEIAN